MKFSDLLREAIRSTDEKMPDEKVEAIAKPILDFLQAWVAIHEPDGENVTDPQRALVLQLLEELGDRIPIPIVS